jgi:hypothetical protein
MAGMRVMVELRGSKPLTSCMPCIGAPARAGAGLLNTVIDPGTSAELWVADPNPRTQAFYSKHGFQPDGMPKVDDGIREIRMVRR